MNSILIVKWNHKMRTWTLNNNKQDTEPSLYGFDRFISHMAKQSNIFEEAFAKGMKLKVSTKPFPGAYKATWVGKLEKGVMYECRNSNREFIIGKEFSHTFFKFPRVLYMKVKLK